MFERQEQNKQLVFNGEKNMFAVGIQISFLELCDRRTPLHPSRIQFNVVHCNTSIYINITSSDVRKAGGFRSFRVPHLDRELELAPR